MPKYGYLFSHPDALGSPFLDKNILTHAAKSP